MKTLIIAFLLMGSMAYGQVTLTITVPAGMVSNIIEILDEQVDPAGAGSNYKVRGERWLKRLANRAVKEFKNNKFFNEKRQEIRIKREENEDLDVF